MSHTVEIDSRKDGFIKSLTVYSSGKAEVVRKYDLQLQAGDNAITVTGLSTYIDQNSVRVSGLGTAARLVDLVTTVKPHNHLFNPNETLRLLGRKKEKLQAEKVINQQEADIYSAYAKQMSSEHVSLDNLVAFARISAEKQRTTVEANAELDEQIREIDKLMTENNTKQSVGHATASVTAHMFVDAVDEMGSAAMGHTQSLEPDDNWKENLKAQIDAELVPEVEKAKGDQQIEAGTQREIELMNTYVGIANQKFDSALATERERRARGTSQHSRAMSLTLTYTVSRASWKPIYDLHAFSQTAEPLTSVTLNYRAFVTQSTGEDWKNAPLTLSTLSDTMHSVEIPHLPTYKIRPKPGLFGGQTRARPSSEAFTTMSSGPTPVIIGGGGLFGQAASTFAHAPPAPVPQAIRTTHSEYEELEAPQVEEETETEQIPLTEGATVVVQSNPLSVSYRVDHPVNVPSDGVAHTISVTTLTLKADVARVCIPRFKPVVYLQCNVENSTDYRLLSGQVHVFYNDSFVCSTSIKDVVQKESFECALGIDEALRVKYERLDVPSASPNVQTSIFGEAKRITQHVARARISNNSPAKVQNVRIRDALPVASDNAIKVTLKKPDGLADASPDTEVLIAEDIMVQWYSEGKSKRSTSDGRYEWAVDINPGEEKTLETEWEIKVPLSPQFEIVANRD